MLRLVHIPIDNERDRYAVRSAKVRVGIIARTKGAENRDRWNWATVSSSRARKLRQKGFGDTEEAAMEGFRPS